MSKTEANLQQQIWYIHVLGQTKGPLSLRDLDVLLRTNEINSRTLGWKNGFAEWKALNDIQEIKEQILESSKQMIQISKKRENLFDLRQNAASNNQAGNLKNQLDNKKQQKNPNQLKQQGDQGQIQNKDEDPLAILQSTVQSLLKKTFYQSEDGKWNIYDEEKQQWITQNQEPKEQIQKLKEKLVSQLKASLFFDQKTHNTRRKNLNKNIVQQQLSQKQLTKQELIKRQKNRKKAKRAAEKKKQKWYKSRINTYIYISGLPFDITFEELRDFVSKAGIVRIDHSTGKQKIKLYKDQDGCPKGDAAISYARPQSVEIAIQILDGSEIRSGFPVKIERAEFQQKQHDYVKRQSKKLSKIQKVLAKKQQAKMFTWDENGEEVDGLRIVILKHIFTPQLSQDLNYVESAKNQIVEELSSIGQIQRVRFYEAHIDGVVEVKFKIQKDAEQCIHVMNGRFYDGRQIVCEYWDGQTDYKRSGDLFDMARIQNFGKQLEGMVKGLQEIKQQSQQEELQVEHVDQKQIKDQLKQENDGNS